MSSLTLWEMDHTHTHIYIHIYICIYIYTYNAENVSIWWRYHVSVVDYTHKKCKGREGWDFLLYPCTFYVYTPRLKHDNVIKWKHFPRYWPFVREIHRSPVNSPHRGQWRGALMFSLICSWINGWVNNPEAGDLIRHRAHYNVTVMKYGT